jgi:signal transduction histidine kinase
VLQKDNDIKKLEIIHQINFRNYLIVISGLILILILVIYSRYRTKKKANKILSERSSQILKQKNQLSKTLNQLRETQKTLVDISHRTGMAEIANGILHNVGNVLNSVKVSSQILKEKIEGSRINNLQKSLALIEQHKTDLANYITLDNRGKMLPDYLIKVGRALKDEQDTCINELLNLYEGIRHIEGIISVQQNYAGVSGVKEKISLIQIMNDIIKMYQDLFNKYKIKVHENYKELSPILTEKAKLMQVLVNILKNAKESLEIKKDENRVITINIFKDKEKEYQIIEIIDNGIGIEKENLDKIFSYGFTTKKNSKGFGLHTSALAMEDIKGEILAYSDGKDKGAKFSVLVTEI